MLSLDSARGAQEGCCQEGARQSSRAAPLKIGTFPVPREYPVVRKQAGRLRCAFCLGTVSLL